MGKQPSTWPTPPEHRPDDSLSDVALTATIVAGLLDASPDGLLMVDASGRMLLVNTRVEQMFGYRRSELLGEPVEMLLPEAVRRPHIVHRDRYSAQPRLRPMGLGLALRGLRSDGSEFPVEISLSPLATGDGQWTVATVRDDEARQTLERERREAAVSDEQGRIAEDLADTVIRGLFGTGLHLQSLLERPGNEIRPGLERAVEDIDRTIRDVRDAIFGLRRGTPAS